MGAVELDSHQLTIYSHLVTYGHAADVAVTEAMRDEIESLWNEPHAFVIIKKSACRVVFRITAAYNPTLTPLEVYQNVDPRNNYFRIEDFAHGNISFVDGLGCNSGYFMTANLYKGSTTAAHEYGHTLGLDHPSDLDIRGQGVPGIMYPRGTWVDPPFQYESDKAPGTKGGTMHPAFRRVRKEDVDLLRLDKMRFTNNRAIIGAFTNYWHEAQVLNS